MMRVPLGEVNKQHDSGTVTDQIDDRCRAIVAPSARRAKPRAPIDLDCPGRRLNRYSEFTLGAAEFMESGRLGDVQFESRTIGSRSMVALTSKRKVQFRRTWGSVQLDGSDIASLCFVLRGSVVVSYSGGVTTARSGDFFVVRSAIPFTAEVHPQDGVHKMLYITAPMHTLPSETRREMQTGLHLECGDRKLSVAMRLVELLADSGSDIHEPTADQLLTALLAVLGAAVEKSEQENRYPRSIFEQRLRDVLRYIERHLSDPNLSTASVSRGCGISQRYLSALLLRHGERFREIMWRMRLEAASALLSDAHEAETSIGEIAYRLGFKAPAHFSRMFKRELKMSPGEFRRKSVRGFAKN